MAKKPRKSRSQTALKGRAPRAGLRIKRERVAASARASMRTSQDSPGIPVAFGTFISTLARRDIQVLKPIPVTFELEEDGSYVASFLDAGVSSGGQTLRDATWSLQEMMAASFHALRDKSDEELGPKMRRQRDVLLEFLCPSSPRPTPKTLRES